MADRSFKEYIGNRFYDEFFVAIKNYLIPRRKSIEFNSRVVSTVDFAELSDIKVQMVGIDDRDNMEIAFDVVLEAEVEIKEYSYRYDTKDDTCYPWFKVSCVADLARNLDDFRILNICEYNQKGKQNKPLSDALVPISYKDDLEQIATDFLRQYHPESLQQPMPIDINLLTERLGLKIAVRQITDDFSVFGQIFFGDCDASVYDEKKGEYVNEHFPAKTIVVDPNAYLLRNLGSVNNTIVHECVHWVKHRKAYELERLYNSSASQIKCLVIGGTKNTTSRSATDWMEWQANMLAPRIQMPQENFKAKALEFIKQYKREMGTYETVDVMEKVIEALHYFFVVSKHAAKLRLIELGFDEALGAFTYIDGKYVKPHAFKKGSLKRNQTYCISSDDAEVIFFSNMRLCEQSKKGSYIYVDSHFCLNDSKYVYVDENQHIQMTEYGRLHIDECCLAFDLKVKAKNKYGEEFYKECVLFRDADSGIVFTTSFSADASASVLGKADAIISRGKQLADTASQVPGTFGEALKFLMKWADNITVEKLAEAAQLDPKTVQRMRNDANYPRHIESVVAVCIGMHLPPELSSVLLDRSGFTLMLLQKESHLMYNFFLQHLYTGTVRDCNEYLVAKNLPILTNEQ